MFRDGVYRLLGRSWDHDGNEHKRLLNRFLIDRGCIQHLEDHLGHASTLLPEGPMDYRIMDRLATLSNSGYYQLVNEDDIAQGMHPDLLEHFDTGPIEPEQKFWIRGTDYPQPQLVEVWGDCVTLAGKTLTDNELRTIMDKVKEGTYVLTPEEV